MFNFLRKLFVGEKLTKIQRTILDLETIDPEIFRKVFSSDWGTYTLESRYGHLDALRKALESFTLSMSEDRPIDAQRIKQQPEQRNLSDLFLSSGGNYLDPDVVFINFKNSAVAFLNLYEERDLCVLDESDRPRSLIVLRIVVQELITLTEHLVYFHRTTERKMLGLYN